MILGKILQRFQGIVKNSTFPELGDDSSGIDISVWILESRFKDAEIKKMTEKGAVCAEKRSFAKSRNVFWEL